MITVDVTLTLSDVVTILELLDGKDMSENSPYAVLYDTVMLQAGPTISEEMQRLEAL